VTRTKRQITAEYTEYTERLKKDTSLVFPCIPRFEIQAFLDEEDSAVRISSRPPHMHPLFLLIEWWFFLGLINQGPAFRPYPGAALGPQEEVKDPQHDPKDQQDWNQPPVQHGASAFWPRLPHVGRVRKSTAMRRILA
jgi:hypothetical protein